LSSAPITLPVILVWAETIKEENIPSSSKNNFILLISKLLSIKLIFVEIKLFKKELIVAGCHTAFTVIKT